MWRKQRGRGGRSEEGEDYKEMEKEEKEREKGEMKAQRAASSWSLQRPSQVFEGQVEPFIIPW